MFDTVQEGKKVRKSVNFEEEFQRVDTKMLTELNYKTENYKTTLVDFNQSALV